MKTLTRVILFFIIVAGMTVSARTLLQRMNYEKQNKTVEIVVDYNDLKFSTPLGVTHLEVLERAAAAGATSLGVYEDTVKSLLDSGEAVALPQKIIPQTLRGLRGVEASPETKHVRIIFARTTPVEEKLRSYLPAYFGKDVCPGGLRYCYLPLPPGEDENISLGLSAVPKTSLFTAPRFINTPMETKESISLKLQEMTEQGDISSLIFDGDSVLGFPSLIEDVADGMNERQLVLGWVEMVEQDGEEMLKEKASETIVVHSISLEEMKKTTREENIQRFVRAVRERGVRIIYVHFPLENTGVNRDKLLTENLNYLSELADEIRKSGYNIGKAQPALSFEVSPFRRAVIFSGMIAFCLFLLSFITAVPSWLLLACGILVFPAYKVAALAGAEDLLTKAGALAAASLVPACAVAIAFLRGTAATENEKVFISPMKTFAAWLNCTLLSLLCGLFIASFLARDEYFAHIDVFAGVKVAYLLPLVLIFWFFIRWSRINSRDLVERPVRYLEVVIGVILLGAAAVYLLRSGNVGVSPASGAESDIRSFLETLFIVRPRTKEFLIGHPALLMMSLIPFARGSFLPVIFLIIGTIGQVSIVNTFCHIHTPIILSLTRTMLGIVLGALIGIIAREILRILLKYKK
ncbi:MAG: DUF5693 family protein [bacterium]